jgi:N-methylhydantoinase A
LDYLLGIDAGGTFIDYLLVNDAGEHTSYKSLARPDAPDYGIIAGLADMADYIGRDLEQLLALVSLIVHGTTVATNAVLTRSGSETALLTTEGLIDLLEMRQGVRDDLYNNHLEAPPPLIERWSRLPVRERIDYQGKVLKPLDQDFLRQQLHLLTRTEVESVAVVLAHSYVNPLHEIQVAKMLRAELPQVHISLSHQVLPRVHMYHRVSTTVLDAYVAPILERYLQGLQEKLQASGFKGTLLIMQSNGGTVTVEKALQLPVMSLLSGPAAGPAMVKCLGQKLGGADAIIMDMGGTSFDVSLFRGGNPGMTDSSVVAGLFYGLPVIDIHTIGAGGGSIARVDSGGLLHVGPESAGAKPGPACYGLGGKDATCTDADLILGLINPDYFLGGRLRLDPAAARQALYENVALPLHTDIDTAALGIYKMVNTEMASGIKEITLEKGLDPRKMTLVVGGGAGALHAAYVARELGISQLLISRESSVMCAVGMLCCNYRRDYYRHCYCLVADMQWQEMQNIYENLWSQAQSQAKNIKGLTLTHKIVFMRYYGQHHEIAVEITEFDSLDSSVLGRLFHNQHHNLYGYDLSDHDTVIEIIGLSIVAQGESRPAPCMECITDNGSRPVLKGSRRACLEEIGAFMEIPVYDGDDMSLGSNLVGPVLVEQRHSTIVVPSGFALFCEGNCFVMKQL